ncbi:hypothetical protein D9M69_430950 [compost metagenome]
MFMPCRLYFKSSILPGSLLQNIILLVIFLPGMFFAATRNAISSSSDKEHPI